MLLKGLKKIRQVFCLHDYSIFERKIYSLPDNMEKRETIYTCAKCKKKDSTSFIMNRTVSRVKINTEILEDKEWEMLQREYGLSKNKTYFAWYEEKQDKYIVENLYFKKEELCFFP